MKPHPRACALVRTLSGEQPEASSPKLPTSQRAENKVRGRGLNLSICLGGVLGSIPWPLAGRGAEPFFLLYLWNWELGVCCVTIASHFTSSNC